jgi:hypothetical protein
MPIDLAAAVIERVSAIASSRSILPGPTATTSPAVTLRRSGATGSRRRGRGRGGASGSPRPGRRRAARGSGGHRGPAPDSGLCIDVRRQLPRQGGAPSVLQARSRNSRSPRRRAAPRQQLAGRHCLPAAGREHGEAHLERRHFLAFAARSAGTIGGTPRPRPTSPMDSRRSERTAGFMEPLDHGQKGSRTRGNRRAVAVSSSIRIPRMRGVYEP